MAVELPVPEGFDLDALQSRYCGYGLVRRLMFVAGKCPDLRVDALRRALVEVRRGTNTALYDEVRALAEGPPPAEAAAEGADAAGADALPAELAELLDPAWVDETDARAHKALDRLSAELKTHQTNLVKDAIRLSHTQLGEHHFARGDFTQALKSFVRTRDYCTASQHVSEMCLNVLRASVVSANYLHVSQYVNKAEHLPSLGDPAVPVKLNCCAGLQQLEARNYKNAARRFLAITDDFSYPEVTCPRDVAVMGALCALASFTRQELKSRVIDNAPFKATLEQVPAVRDLVLDFYASRYAPCLAALERLRPQLALDAVLAKHVAPIYNQIRQRGLIQYFSAYLTVNLSSMAATFNTTVEDIEKELSVLIMDGRISARIDSHNQVLRARHMDRRIETYQRAMRVGQAYARDAQTMLMRLSLAKHEFVLRQRGGFGLGSGGV